VQCQLHTINKSKTAIKYYRTVSTIMGIKVIFNLQRGNGGNGLMEIQQAALDS
jgi:hypothetical protein